MQLSVSKTKINPTILIICYFQTISSKFWYLFDFFNASTNFSMEDKINKTNTTLTKNDFYVLYKILEVRIGHLKKKKTRIYSYICSWYITGYVNDFDAPVLYSCPNGGYINGVASYHHNHYEDRRYRFRCCVPYSRKPCLFIIINVILLKVPFFKCSIVFYLGLMNYQES